MDYVSLKAVEMTRKGQFPVLTLRFEENEQQPLVRAAGKEIAQYPPEKQTSAATRKQRECAGASCKHRGIRISWAGNYNRRRAGRLGWGRKLPALLRGTYFRISQPFYDVVESTEGCNVNKYINCKTQVMISL